MCTCRMCLLGGVCGDGLLPACQRLNSCIIVFFLARFRPRYALPGQQDDCIIYYLTRIFF